MKTTRIKFSVRTTPRPDELHQYSFKPEDSSVFQGVIKYRVTMRRKHIQESFSKRWLGAFGSFYSVLAKGEDDEIGSPWFRAWIWLGRRSSEHFLCAWWWCIDCLWFDLQVINQYKIEI